MNGHTPCASEGCTRTAADGHVLYRVNAKGQPGIFMCEEHARAKDEAERRLWYGDAYSDED